ncbi:hypothetical protein QOT17_018743 [Balamuthia mandrillaris]
MGEVDDGVGVEDDEDFPLLLQAHSKEELAQEIVDPIWEAGLYKVMNSLQTPDKVKWFKTTVTKDNYYYRDYLKWTVQYLKQLPQQNNQITTEEHPEGTSFGAKWLSQNKDFTTKEQQFYTQITNCEKYQ